MKTEYRCQKPACAGRPFQSAVALRMHTMRVHTKAGRNAHLGKLKTKKENTNAKENSNSGSQSYSYHEGYVTGHVYAQVQFLIADSARKDAIPESVLAVRVAESLLRDAGERTGKPMSRVRRKTAVL